MYGHLIRIGAASVYALRNSCTSSYRPAARPIGDIQRNFLQINGQGWTCNAKSSVRMKFNVTAAAPGLAESPRSSQTPNPCNTAPKLIRSIACTML